MVGHIAKRNNNRWTKKMTESQPMTGKRREDKNADGERPGSIIIRAQLGSDCLRTEDGFYMRGATPTFGFNSQQGK